MMVSRATEIGPQPILRFQTRSRPVADVSSFTESVGVEDDGQVTPRPSRLRILGDGIAGDANDFYDFRIGPLEIHCGNLGQLHGNCWTAISIHSAKDDAGQNETANDDDSHPKSPARPFRGCTIHGPVPSWPCPSLARFQRCSPPLGNQTPPESRPATG